MQHDQIKKLYHRGVPLVACSSPDYRDALHAISKASVEAATESGSNPLTIYTYDAAALLYCLTENRATPANAPLHAIIGSLHESAPAQLHILHAERFLNDPRILAALANARDTCKLRSCSIWLHSAQWQQLPPEISGDAYRVSFDLPTPDAIQASITALATGNGVEAAITPRMVSALSGMSMFQAEQSAAMTLTKAGYDESRLYDAKREMIRGVPGLSLPSVESAPDVIGADAVMGYLSRIFESKRPPAALVFLDEIEKMLAGSGDTSGTTQALIGQFLSWTEDNSATGLIATGIPGAGKSLTAKRIARNYGVPLISLSLSGMKGSLVGESERNLRTALATINAIAQGPVYMIATCNSMQAMTPEMQARFRDSVWFYDSPTPEAAADMWRHYGTMHECGEAESCYHLPFMGREIAATCERAAALEIPPVEAARYVCPVLQSRAAEIDAIRRAAAGNYLSTTTPGPYQMPERANDARRVHLN